MSKFFPIAIRPAGFYYEGMTGRKAFGISVDKEGVFRVIIEYEDKSYQQQLSMQDVNNFGSWFDLALRSVVYFYQKGIFNASHSFKLNNDIELILECDCSTSRDYKYRHMLKVDSPIGQQVFNISGKQKHIFPVVEDLRGTISEVKSSFDEDYDIFEDFETMV